MLLPLFEWLSELYSGFNVFQYSTFRTILSVLTALGVSMLMGAVDDQSLDQSKNGSTDSRRWS